MRRKRGTLTLLERAILHAGLQLAKRGQPDFHGFAIARELRDREGARNLIGHGTLYKALDRMAQGGLLRSRWEDPMVAAEAGRPRRRFYEVTPAGARALAAAQREQPMSMAQLRAALSTH